MAYYESGEELNLNSNLHVLMDSKVEDIYTENDRFKSLLNIYYDKRDSSILKELGVIIYRCACNILKKKYGYSHTWQWIALNAIDTTEALLHRIVYGLRNNGERYYIINLPVTVKYSLLNSIQHICKDYNYNEVKLDKSIELLDMQSERDWKENLNNWEDIICVCVDNNLDIEEYL